METTLTLVSIFVITNVATSGARTRKHHPVITSAISGDGNNSSPNFHLASSGGKTRKGGREWGGQDKGIAGLPLTLLSMGN